MFLRLGPSALLATTLLTASLALAADSPSLVEIHAAWKKRTDNIKSVQMHWTETQTLEIGGFDTNGGMPIPAEKTTYTVKKQLTLDETKLRFDDSGAHWQRNRGLVDLTVWTTWNNESRRTYISSSLDRSKTPHPVAMISAHTSNSLFADPLVYFPIWHFRALHPLIGAEHVHGAPRSAVTLAEQQLEGAPCIVTRQDVGRKSHEIWIDPALDHSIRRLRIYADRQLEYELTTTYAKDARHGWLPQAWQYSIFRGMPLINSGVAKVTKIDINPKIPAATFTPDFPKGAIVYDQRNQEAWYIKNDGSNRIITADEKDRRATYEEIAESESDEAGKNRKADKP